MSDPAIEAEVVRYYQDPQGRANPFDFFAKVREHSPVYYSSSQDKWMVTGYEELKSVSSYPEFSYQPSSQCPYEPGARAGRSISLLRNSFMLYLDPPKHTKYRSAVRRTFSGPTARAWRPRIRSWARELVESLPRATDFDFVSDLALPVPFHFTCELLGIPQEDWPKIKKYADGFQRLFTPNPSPEDDAYGDQIFDEFCDYLAPYIAERERGVVKDDLLQEFVEAKRAGEFSYEEIAMFAQILTVGGHETTQALLTQGMIDFLANPDEWELLQRDPELLEGAIEEVLRYSGPSTEMQSRFPTDDVEIGGQFLKKGARVVTHPSAANRDPRVFDDPDRFDIRREHANVAFGFGPHFCIAASLVRVEAQEIFGAIAEIAPNIEITQPGPVEYSSLETLRLPTSLTVRIPS